MIWLRKLLLILVFCVMEYLVGAFTQWSFDGAEWRFPARVLVGLIMGFTCFAIAIGPEHIFTSDNKSDNSGI